MLPVRCFSCNKVIGRYEIAFHSWKQSQLSSATGKSDSIPYTEFFEKHGISRYCCRKIFLTYIDVFDVEHVIHPIYNVDIRKGLEVKKIVTTD